MTDHTMGPADYARVASEITDAVSRRIAGQPVLIRDTLTGLLAEGHVLLEGVPGLGKTELVKALAAAVGLEFGRVQFTPDLMPADIVGTQVLEETSGGRTFEYQPGPVFTNLLLADEINRATPKTQAALLESMQERSVTVAGETRNLPRPFLVLATQNPIELEGTYPLPEAQLDRFMLKATVSPPDEDTLVEIIDRTTGGAVPDVPVVADAGTLRAMIALTPTVPIASHLVRYTARLVGATHPTSPSATATVRRLVRFGASPRGAQAIILAAKVSALLDGSPHVRADDIRRSVPSSLRHRVVLGYEAAAEGVGAAEVVDELLAAVPEPKAEVRGVS